VTALFISSPKEKGRKHLQALQTLCFFLGRIYLCKKKQVEGEIHIGNMVKAELNRQDLSISWLARQVCCDASNLNKQLRKPSIHTDLLIRISNVLRHNFFFDIAGLLN